MNELKITFSTDETVSQDDLITNYRDLEEYILEQIPDIQRTKLVENKQHLAGVKGDISTFELIISAAPGYIQAAIMLIDHWNNRNNKLPGKKVIRAKPKLD